MEIPELAGLIWLFEDEPTAALPELGRLSIVRREDCEGLELRFAGAKFEPLCLRKKPEIKLSWDVVSAGTW